jgi:hypothetical protein
LTGTDGFMARSDGVSSLFVKVVSPSVCVHFLNIESPLSDFQITVAGN